MAGPFNSYEVENTDGYLDFGSLLIPMETGLDVSVSIDPANGKIASVSLIYLNSIATVELFAAAKEQDSWSETRYEIAGKLEETKVVPKIVSGFFGAEIHAVMPVYDQLGNANIQAIRFLGVNGDRWFIRVAISGLAASEQNVATELDSILSKLVINRGMEAMPPGVRLPLEFPSNGAEIQEKPNQSLHIEI